VSHDRIESIVSALTKICRTYWRVKRED